MVDADTSGEQRPNAFSEATWNSFHEMAFAPSSPPRPPSPPTDDIVLPNPGELAEAVAWAQTHEVAGKDALAWLKKRTPPKVDLRLAQSALPVVSELLVSRDMPLARTALIALQLNGAQVETDVGWESPLTRFDVKFPDGTVRTVEFT